MTSSLPRPVRVLGNAGSTATSEICNVKARFFSRERVHTLRVRRRHRGRAGPLRLRQVRRRVRHLLGRYAGAGAEGDPSQEFDFRDEGDWFDDSVGQEDGEGAGNGHFDAVTQKVWRYFGGYLPFWLTS